eukprot:CAMPEP_0179335082 /NCGR_PEP_ID=MMETSP0797-20121207/66297_1 /TAXON_ID=47934 /ORGANISM="Dinophysis acuminata, Strain DAEP01" /LENGTH=43 /DNA_ID= /DNA_START= /DNA_END= /DNA_ORIENTATION=
MEQLIFTSASLFVRPGRVRDDMSDVQTTQTSLNTSVAGNSDCE